MLAKKTGSKKALSVRTKAAKKVLKKSKPSGARRTKRRKA
jgi:hypothetical protein